MALDKIEKIKKLMKHLEAGSEDLNTYDWQLIIEALNKYLLMLSRDTD